VTSAQWGDRGRGGAGSGGLFDQDDERTTAGPLRLAAPPARRPAVPPPRAAAPGASLGRLDAGRHQRFDPPPDPAFAPRVPDGVRLAVPEAERWHLPRKLATRPTLLGALAGVVVAFLIGLALGSGGSSTVAAKPAASVAPTTTTTLPPATTHTVAAGETLASIAATYKVTVQDLAGFNNITNLNHVFVGELLHIPAPIPTTTTTTPLNH
jgi:LysM repeat protein